MFLLVACIEMIFKLVHPNITVMLPLQWPRRMMQLHYSGVAAQACRSRSAKSSPRNVARKRSGAVSAGGLAAFQRHSLFQGLQDAPQVVR